MSPRSSRGPAAAGSLPRGARPRRMRLLGSLLALGLTVTACGSGGGQSDPATSTETSTAVIVIDADPETLNPGLTTTNSTLDVSSKIFESLVWIDPQGTPQPQLATAWQVSADNLTYTFDLRPGVTWHDGQPFTSADVSWTLAEGLAENARAQGVLGKIASVETPSELQVVVTLKQPYAPFLQQMKVGDVPILPRHVFAGTDLATNPANTAPIGTGPFRFDSRAAGSSITLVANPTYWDAGKPMLTRLVFSIVPDAATRAAGLETGEYDFLASYYLPRSDVARLEGTPSVAVRTETSIPALHFAMFNEQNPLLAQAPVRQAIARAVDRDRIVAQAMSGIAAPGVGAFGQGFPWLVDEAGGYPALYPLDPAAARAELDQAGVPPTTSLRLVYDSSKAQFQAASQIIRDDLAKIGVTVDIQPLETSVFRERVYAQRDYDIALQSFTSSGDPAIGYHRMYVTNNDRSPNINPTGYTNPTVDQLLAQAGAVADLGQRAEFYKQATQILDRDIPVLVMYDEQQADAASTRLQGLYSAQSSSDQWGGVSITSTTN